MEEFCKHKGLSVNSVCSWSSNPLRFRSPACATHQPVSPPQVYWLLACFQRPLTSLECLSVGWSLIVTYAHVRSLCGRHTLHLILEYVYITCPHPLKVTGMECRGEGLVLHWALSSYDLSALLGIFGRSCTLGSLCSTVLPMDVAFLCSSCRLRIPFVSSQSEAYLKYAHMCQ